MKKLICVLLTAVMVLALCACGSSNDGGAAAPAENVSALKVGYSRVIITPEYSVPLRGYGNTSMRMSAGKQTELTSTCIAYSDGEDTILVIQNDLANSDKTIVANVRKAVNKKLGIPEDHVMVAATHTHSGPDTSSSEPSIAKYRPQLEKWMLEAAEEAVADMVPVTGIYHGTTLVEGMNFVRHYTTEAGIIKGDNLNNLVDSPYTGHTHDADNVMQAVRIERDGKDNIVLINWQSHPHRGGGSKKYDITADIVGVMRDYVEQNVDGVLFAYYTGASGNINPHSAIAKENITKDYWEQGKALGAYAVKILGGEMTKLEGTNVQITGKFYTGQTDHHEDHLVEVAQIVAEHWRENNDFLAACALANSYGMNSPYHAQAIISKSQLGYTYDVEMYAFSIGDLGFITAPYEMFDTQGVTIREGSPFAATFVVTCSNDGIGYIPSMEGFNNNTYEANNGKFMPGTGEALADEYVKMLEALYATK